MNAAQPSGFANSRIEGVDIYSAASMRAHQRRTVRTTRSGRSSRAVSRRSAVFKQA